MTLEEGFFVFMWIELSEVAWDLGGGEQMDVFDCMSRDCMRARESAGIWCDGEDGEVGQMWMNAQGGRDAVY
jgi:hypothetical protein